MAAIRRRVAGRSTGMFLPRRCELRFSKHAESTPPPGRRARPRENRICEHVAGRAARHASGAPGLDSGAAVVRGHARSVLHGGSAAGGENRNAAGTAAHDRGNEAAERPARGRLPQFRVMRGALRGGGGGKIDMRRISRKGKRRVKGAAILTVGRASARRARVPGAPNAAHREGAVRDAMRTSPSVSSRQGIAAACPGSRSIRAARRGATARRESSRRRRHRDRGRPPEQGCSRLRRPRSWRSAATGGPSRTRSRRARGPLPR